MLGNFVALHYAYTLKNMATVVLMSYGLSYQLCYVTLGDLSYVSEPEKKMSPLTRPLLFFFS